MNFIIIFLLFGYVKASIYYHTAYAGDLIELNCPVSKNAATVQWIKASSSPGILPELIVTEGTKLNLNLPFVDRIAVNLTDNNTYILQIQNVTLPDGGKFVCESALGNDFMHTIFFLLVVEVVIFPTPIIEGKDVNISCLTTDFPEPYWEVYFVRNEVNYINASSIHLRNVSRNDTGQYSCFVRHEFQTYIYRSSVVVAYPPDVNIDYGNKTIRCDAYGYPTDVDIFKLEHLSFYGEHIRFIEYSANGITLNRYEDNGKYVCSAQNGIPDRNGKLVQTNYKLIKVKGSPVFILNYPKVVYGQKDAIARIEACLHCYPSCTNLTWMLGSRYVETNTRKYDVFEKHLKISTSLYNASVHVDGIRTTLIIYYLQMKDFQKYTVYAENDVGNAYHDIYLQEIENEGYMRWELSIYIGIPVFVVVLVSILSIYRFAHCCHQRTMVDNIDADTQVRNSAAEYETINEAQMVELAVINQETQEKQLVDTSPTSSEDSSKPHSQISADESDDSYLNPYHVIQNSLRDGEKQTHSYIKLKHDQNNEPKCEDICSVKEEDTDSSEERVVFHI